MAVTDPTADQSYREKMAARSEGRAPVIAAPIVAPEGADANERYRAKVANRQAAAKQPQVAPVATKPEAKTEAELAEETRLKAESDEAARKATEAAELAALEAATKPEHRNEPRGNRPR